MRPTEVRQIGEAKEAARKGRGGPPTQIYGTSTKRHAPTIGHLQIPSLGQRIDTRRETEGQRESKHAQGSHIVRLDLFPKRILTQSPNIFLLYQRFPISSHLQTTLTVLPYPHKMSSLNQVSFLFNILLSSNTHDITTDRGYS